VDAQRETSYSDDSDKFLSALFSDPAKWSVMPDQTGAEFTRLVMELADLPGIERARLKPALEAWWTGLLRKAIVFDSPVLARAHLLLGVQPQSLSLLMRQCCRLRPAIHVSD
jgi:hypothetical protein